MREISNNLFHNKDNSKIQIFSKFNKIPKQYHNRLHLYSKTINDKSL